MNKKIVLFVLMLAFSFLQVQGQKDIYAVIVGVSDYENDHLNLDLNYCDDDARSFYNLLISSGIDEDNVVLLIDYNAGKQNIINKLDLVFSKADSDDEVIFYFSGHGDRGSFIPYDFSGTYSSVLDHTDIKAAFKASEAKKKLCIADACFSGSIKRPASKSLFKGKSKSLKKSADIAVMMSSRDYQTSQELPSLRSGVFTYYLVQGLKGSADKNSDKTITVSEMYYYTKERVMLETNDKQVPIIFGDFDEGMPILYLK